MTIVPASEPFGIYVHVPYCVSLCPYCDFNSYVQRDPPWEALRRAWTRELAARVDLMGTGPVASVYFGGGTPSLAPPRELAGLLEDVARASPCRGRRGHAGGQSREHECGGARVAAGGGL